MTKAYSVLKVKTIADTDDERTITGIASTPKMDRDSDIVEAKGAVFALPIPLLWQHNHNQPIGEVTSAFVNDSGQVEFTAKIAKIDEAGNLKERIDEAWQSIKSGLVKCVSVGFRALDYEYMEDSYGLHIKSWEWYELSVVTVAANPDAIITSAKQIKKAFTDADTEKPPTTEFVDLIQTTTKCVESTILDDAAPAVKSFVNLVDPNQGSIRLLSGE